MEARRSGSVKTARWALALATAAGGATAQGWSPQRNVEIVAGSAPGGSNDNTARTMERVLIGNKLVPTTTTVANRPGGGGSIAYTYVSQKPGDGHLLYIASAGMLSNHIIGANALNYTGSRRCAGCRRRRNGRPTSRRITGASIS